MVAQVFFEVWQVLIEQSDALLVCDFVLHKYFVEVRCFRGVQLLDFFNVANDLRYLVALAQEHSQFILIDCPNFLRSSLRHSLKVTVYLRPNRGHVFARLSLLRV